MLEGLSTNRHCHPHTDCLVGEGKRFVIRYHSRTTQQPQKRISPQEAAELARAGLQIATVYQDRARRLEDFGFERGRLDGASAEVFAAQIGQPPGSAVYFAVDTDLFPRDVRGHVLPYFRGVKAGMDEAAGATSAFDLGVYGSGLVCRMVRDDAQLVRYAWLAEATGWLESRTYDRWDVRQHLNTGQALCGLGVAWQRCEARDSFGQFLPVGFEVRREEGGALMQVTASVLNVRDVPSDRNNVPRAKLHQGEVVRVLGAAQAPWLRIRGTGDKAGLIGYASGKFLQALDDAVAPAPPPPPLPPAVHFGEHDARARRDSASARARPIGEPGAPRRDPAAPAAARAAALIAIAAWLDVERQARWQPGDVTYCNVYAADVCYLAGVYLPRCWWKDAALMQIAQGPVPAVVYDETVRELRADDLYAWLKDWGPRYGWRRVFDASALQAAANAGGIGLIIADNQVSGAPGHISVVVPEELPRKRARRDADGNVTLPLQSQAGRRNFRASVIGRAWWLDETFGGEFAFFVHD
jgi:hypothetical protein